MIYDLKTNHIKRPLGFSTDVVVLSYKNKNIIAKRQEMARIEVFADETKNVCIFDSDWRSDIYPNAFELKILLHPRKRYYWRVSVIDDTGRVETSDITWFETGKRNEPWSAQWITGNLNETQIIHRNFVLHKEVQSARIYVCGLGLYELHINDEKVGTEFLSPGFNNYSRWIQVQTYDVTKYLSDVNKIAVILGDGWYKGRFGSNTSGCLYGDQQCLLLELHINYSDGSEQIIASNNVDWYATRNPIVFSNIYDGETYDALVDMSETFQVHEIAVGYDCLKDRLSLPIVIHQKIVPQAIFLTPKGEVIMDIGQEISGWVEFDSDIQKGHKQKLSYFELLQNNCFYVDNLRTAKQEYTFISDGNQQHVRPHFTFYGFRYVKLEGFVNPDISNFYACVLYSDIEHTGNIVTNNEGVNKLVQNSIWSQRGNFIDTPTDCPQRDERLGWTGDAQIFSATACFQMDCAAFFRKYLYDMATEQKDANGQVPLIIPSCGTEIEAACGWADAVTIIPWNLYLFYGDITMLREQYPAMKLWVDWLKQNDEAYGGHRLWKNGFHYGDWLAMDSPNQTATGATSTEYLCSAYYYYSCTLTSKAASVLGLEMDAKYYQTLASEVLEALRKEYFTPGGKLAEITQTGFIVALFMGFAPKQHIEKIKKMLRLAFRASSDSLRTGFIGTAYVNHVLSSFDMNDLAYRLLLNENFPSWLYEVNMGATTIWERWNSILPDGKISGTDMNSLNHYANGVIVEWLFRVCAGIQPIETNPGYREFLLHPHPSNRLSSVSVEYESASGLICSSWKIHEDNSFEFHVVVPFNTRAKCILPNAPDQVVSVHPLLNFCRQGNDLTLLLLAGEYIFHYFPTKPLSPRFTMDSSMLELLQNDKASDVLKKYMLPLRYQRYVENPKGTLGDILTGPYSHMSNDDFLTLEYELHSIE